MYIYKNNILQIFMYRTYTDNQIDAVSTNPYRQCIGEVETRLTRRQGKWEKVVGRGAIAWWGLPVGLMALFQADSKTSRYSFKRVNLSIFFWRREDQICKTIAVSCQVKSRGSVAFFKDASPKVWNHDIFWGRKMWKVSWGCSDGIQWRDDSWVMSCLLEVFPQSRQWNCLEFKVFQTCVLKLQSYAT